jgi:hypothetical protein
MTTIGSAADWRAPARDALTALVLCAGFGLAGCESGNSLFASPVSTDAAANQSSQPAATAQQSAQARIAVAPIIGAPDAIGKQIQQEFTAAVEKQRVVVAGKDDHVDYTLRGYIVAAKDKSATKVSYIWDVTEPSGKRAHRITGEEIIPGGAAKDPWSTVTPAVAQTIAGKAAASFTSWLPSQTQQAVASTATPHPAGVGVQSTPAATATVPPTPPASAPTSPASPPTSSAPLPTSTAAAVPPPRVQTAALQSTPPPTNSISRDGAVTTLVSGVTGAPGDGSSSLTGALQRELSNSGVVMAHQASASTYTVEGKVTLGEAKNGKQSIHIDWIVKDPAGKRVGTVSQKNEIPEGSLDGQWGKTADAAASAAAQGILKLLPSSKAVN